MNVRLSAESKVPKVVGRIQMFRFIVRGLAVQIPEALRTTSGVPATPRPTNPNNLIHCATYYKYFSLGHHRRLRIHDTGLFPYLMGINRISRIVV